MGEKREKPKRQTKVQIAQLIARYPAIGVIKSSDIFQILLKKLFRECPTETTIKVQRADTNTMHMRANNIRLLSDGYLADGEGLRAAQLERLYAINKNHEILDLLYWGKNEKEKTAKDIFQVVKSEEVEYLVWITYRDWFNPSSEENEKEGIYFDFDKQVKKDFQVYIYLKPKNMTFAELVKKAEEEKKEKEEAYLHNPKQMPELPGIEQALKENYKLHAFLSGGGLRVVYTKGKDDKGYGEAPHIEETLVHANEDFLAGGRKYHDVYGKLYPHYLTGSSLSSSNLDHWVRQGQTIDWWFEKGMVVCKLSGYSHTEIPEEITKQVIQQGKSRKWKNRGFTYKISPIKFPNGELGTSMQVITKSKNSSTDAFMYQITKTGKGKNFWEACLNALDAPEREPVKTET